MGDLTDQKPTEVLCGKTKFLDFFLNKKKGKVWVALDFF